MLGLGVIYLLESIFGVRPEATAADETDTQLSSSTPVPDDSSQGQQATAADETDTQLSSTTVVDDSLPKEQTASNEDKQPSQAEIYHEQGMLLVDCGFYNKAAVKFLSAIELGHNLSRAQLASMLYEGRPGLDKDRKRAHELASTGANLGCVHCKGWLAHDLVLGLDHEVCQIGLVLAMESAEARSCFGQFSLGLYFLREKDSKAMIYLRQASISGCVDASYRLGRLHEEGNLTFSDDWHLYRDLETAFAYYSRAAEKGHITSMIIVARWYEQGKGGANVDISRALSLLREIANGCDKYDVDVHGKIVKLSFDYKEIEAMIMLMEPAAHVAYCFEKQDNPIVRQNAVLLYQILADKGHNNSQVWLAEDALKKKEFARAAEYLRQAAEQGHADSICKLADLILHGSGVAKDPCEAARLYRVAAEKGHQ